MATVPHEPNAESLSFEDFKAVVKNDFRIANESRQASLRGRKEVLTGKAKFGIFGDGKEVAFLYLHFRSVDFLPAIQGFGCVRVVRIVHVEPASVAWNI